MSSAQISLFLMSLSKVETSQLSCQMFEIDSIEHFAIILIVVTVFFSSTSLVILYSFYSLQNVGMMMNIIGGFTVLSHFLL